MKKSKLQAYLDKKGITQTEFAARISTTKVTVCRLCNQETEPSQRVAIAIEKETRGAVKHPDMLLSAKRKAELASEREKKEKKPRAKCPF